MTRPHIDVVGLGPGGPELITGATRALLDRGGVVRLRTAIHPAAAAVDAPSFDHHYEQIATFDDVYKAIVDDLVALAESTGHVVYAVPGSPWVAEHTIELLRAKSDVDVVVHPALSFVELAWSALGIDPIADGVRLIDGHRFATEAAGDRGPLLISQCHDSQILSDIKLSQADADHLSVTVLHHLGLGDQRVEEMRWHEMDRFVDADHLTSIYVPELPARTSTAFGRFEVMVDRLRAECPWDADQTHASLRRHLLEESYETLEALDRLIATDADDPEIDERYDDLGEELGDLLYQIFFHAKLADERGWFDVAEVATAIHDKLFERHPHVFGGVRATLEELPAQWEAAKKAEKSRSSVMDGIPAAVPALLYATKVQKKAEAIGGPVPSGEGASFDESDFGRLLFSLVGRARVLGIDPESALRQHAMSFAADVRAFEANRFLGYEVG